ncbi:metallophosphoesterase [Marinobacterium sp. BA1]|uniref:metallophosphoesterase family protein n=1 Tax=Marinobacterium sp. BA1 TaxID=3138931 RepID=UPI0032E62D31
MMINRKRDLEQLNGPVLLFGGPYSNLAATEAMQAEAQRLQIPPERIICTGDIIAYCAEPVETLELIRRWGIHVVQGNCEQSLGAGAPDCGCGFDADSSCSLLSIEWYRYASQRVSPEQQRWMAELPGQLDFQLGPLQFSVVHGSTQSINEFIFPGTAQSLKQARLSATTADAVVGGHCGIPFGERLECGYWLNAGVIGMPANDGTRDGWYLLLEPDSDGVMAHWHRLPYQAQTSRQRMQQADLCDAYAQALTSGRWPSTDILPEADRLEPATPLKPQTLRLSY